MSLLPPGRFLMPGDLAGSPALTFAPLEIPEGAEPPHGSLAAMMRRRYDSYREVVVQPFFREHFARLDRQIVLVDALAALNAGPDAVRDLQGALVSILDCFRIGRSGVFSALFRPRASKILFAATKADHLHHSAHDRLEAILSEMVASAIAQAGFEGAEVDVIALAAVRATREGHARGEGGTLPSIIGLPAQGETAGGEAFDGESEIAMFPGDLPANAARCSSRARTSFAVSPAVAARTPTSASCASARRSWSRSRTGMPALPHIRLDRAMQFLFGDRMQ